MASKNVIETILVISYNPLYCKYFINNGEQHLCSYEKLRDLLMQLTPTLCVQIEYFLERKLSFFISVNELKIQEVTIDLETVIQKMKEDTFKLSSINIQKYLNEVKKDAIKYQENNNSIINMFFKTKEKI